MTTNYLFVNVSLSSNSNNIVTGVTSVINIITIISVINVTFITGITIVTNIFVITSVTMRMFLNVLKEISLHLFIVNGKFAQMLSLVLS